MQAKNKPMTPAAYVAALPRDRNEIINKMRSVIKKNLPKGFDERIGYGMIGYVVGHAIYPAGYHCDSTQPLPFLFLASQKSHIALYHMGLYADPTLMKWFTQAWSAQCTHKLDMGKSCIRFKKPQDVPLALLGELARRMTVKQWIAIYQKKFVRSKV